MQDLVGARSRSRVDVADPRETLLPMLEGLSRALGFRRGLVLLHEPERGALRGAVGLDVPDSIIEALEVPLEGNEDSPLVAALLEGRPISVPDVGSEPRLHENTTALLLEMGFESFVAAPLQSTSSVLVAPGAGRPPAATWRGQEIPALGVAVLSRAQPITEAEIEQLLPFTTQAGTALARATDVERLRDFGAQHAIEKEWLWWMVNGVEDPVILTDADNNIILQNVRALGLFRANPDDSEGKRRAISMNNFLFTAALSTFSLEREGTRTGRELTLVDPIEGTELLFEIISYPVVNYIDGSRGVVSILKNVTQLRQATDELTENLLRLHAADEEIRQERDRLNLLLRSVPNPIILIGNDNQIITMNQEAVRLLQPLPGMPIGHRAQICLSNETKFTSFVAQMRLDPAAVKHGELVLIDPDTEESLTMAVTTTAVRDDLGAVVASVSVMQDVSRLRELERRRVEHILFESEKLAATGRLAASIAHEINNPLEAIKNALYLLRHTVNADSPDQKFLEIATKETERVSRILRQMLGFYRPASLEPTDVNSLVEEAEALVDKHLRQRHVRIEKDLARELPLITASADQLKQVLLNLLLNAQEAMPDGGTIYISTRLAHGGESEILRTETVSIQVRDTGKGIAEEDVPHIFQPFFSTKRDRQGTGLGLWVSYGIVQSHGGTVRVRSRPGRGTTFSIALPIEGPGERNER